MNKIKVGEPKVSGLDEVVFAETRLSHVDGEKGRLVVCGYDIEELGGQVSFEGICHLLWHGCLPTATRLKDLTLSLGMMRVLAFNKLILVDSAHKNAMDYLRAALGSDKDEEEPSPEYLVAATAVAASIWYRRQAGLAPLEPNPALSHSEDFLRMVTGRSIPQPLVKALDAYLVTVADHGMNASTFASRVVASTGSDLTSAVVAGVGALKGPLHGGAPGPVLDMLDAVGEPEHARDWLESELAAGRRIMGMGHRIYRVRDPRAAVLESAIEKLEEGGVHSRSLTMARAVEKAAAALLSERYPDRPLKANVEFYTAVLLSTIGLPTTLFSATFASGRVAGWCAHVAEQRRYGRLVRPQSNYIGGFDLHVLGSEKENLQGYRSEVTT